MVPFFANNTLKNLREKVSGCTLHFLPPESFNDPRFTRKGQFFVITSVIIVIVLFAIGRVFISGPFNLPDLDENVFEFNSVVGAIEETYYLNLTYNLRQETYEVLRSYYSKRGFSLTFEESAGCTQIHMISRYLDAVREVCS